MSTPLIEKYDFAILGVFADIRWANDIHEFLTNYPEEIYWLPWGDRSLGWNTAGKYLSYHGDWDEINRETKIENINIPYVLFKANQKENSIKFFHHKSQKQGGDGKIHNRYDITYILTSNVDFSPNAKLKHRVVQHKSKTWLGISAYHSAFHNRQPLDFSADFDKISLKNGKKNQMHQTKDSWHFYEDVVFVQHFKHKSIQECSCPQC